MAKKVDVTDVSPRLTGAQRLRRLIAGVLGAAVVAVLATATYKNIYLPNVWRADVAAAKALLRAHDAEVADRLMRHPEVIGLEKLAERLSYGPKEISLSKRIVGVKAALDLADHLGSPAARYIYGIKLKAGRLGMTDSEQASRQFESGLKKIAPLVNAGDARATFYYALMLNSGLGGLEANKALSTSMIRQVFSDLPVLDLDRLLYQISDDSFIINEDGEPFGAHLLMALIDKGEVIDPISVDLVCQKETSSFLVKNCIRAAQRQVEPSASRKLDFSKSGVPTSVAGDATSNVDKEKQSTTGYLKGTPLGASGGHSVFTMDNAKGGSDAVGRLYLNGSKPAARSMYVKAGESFKAQGLAAGSYVFRYRFIGSEETYEADRQVLLTESQSETGVRYSKVTITLYKETGGNLTVKKVSPDDF